jgi:hypothetical protein
MEEGLTAITIRNCLSDPHQFATQYKVTWKHGKRKNLPLLLKESLLQQLLITEPSCGRDCPLSQTLSIEILSVLSGNDLILAYTRKSAKIEG